MSEALKEKIKAVRGHYNNLKLAEIDKLCEAHYGCPVMWGNQEYKNDFGSFIQVGDYRLTFQRDQYNNTSLQFPSLPTLSVLAILHDIMKTWYCEGRYQYRPIVCLFIHLVEQFGRDPALTKEYLQDMLAINPTEGPRSSFKEWLLGTGYGRDNLTRCTTFKMKEFTHEP